MKFARQTLHFHAPICSFSASIHGHFNVFIWGTNAHIRNSELMLIYIITGCCLYARLCSATLFFACVCLYSSVFIVTTQLLCCLPGQDFYFSES